MSQMGCVLRGAAGGWITQLTHLAGETESLLRGGHATYVPRFLETPLLASVISLLQTLWETNLGDRDKITGGPQVSMKHLPLQLVSEFLYVLTALTRHLR